MRKLELNPQKKLFNQSSWKNYVDSIKKTSWKSSSEFRAHKTWLITWIYMPAWGGKDAKNESSHEWGAKFILVVGGTWTNNWGREPRIRSDYVFSGCFIVVFFFFGCATAESRSFHPPEHSLNSIQRDGEKQILNFPVLWANKEK